jgi:hypothetical protein
MFIWGVRPCSFGLLLATLCFGAGGTAHGREKKKDPHTQRIYELVFPAVSLNTEQIPSRPRESAEGEFPHRLVIIHAKVSNVGKQFPCTELDPTLEVKPYNVYRRDVTDPSRWLGFGELLPGQTVEVDYRFTAREGTTPTALIVKARQMNSDRCRQHADWGSMWHAQDQVRIPVDDLPEAPKTGR